MDEKLEILEALHDQVQRVELREIMSPVEVQLANAILVTLNVLIAWRKETSPN